jgi:hypothetical protein
MGNICACLSGGSEAKKPEHEAVAVKKTTPTAVRKISVMLRPSAPLCACMRALPILVTFCDFFRMLDFVQLAEVRRHNTSESIWFVIKGKVYAATYLKAIAHAHDFGSDALSRSLQHSQISPVLAIVKGNEWHLCACTFESICRETCRNRSELTRLRYTHGQVYDVTKFQHTHPGGSGALRRSAGKDVTEVGPQHRLACVSISTTCLPSTMLWSKHITHEPGHPLWL